MYLYINITLHFFSHIHKLALSHYFSLCLVNVRLQKYYHLSSIGYAQHKQHVRQNSLCRIFYVFIFDHIFTALHPLIFCIKLVPAPTKCCRIVTLFKKYCKRIFEKFKNYYFTKQIAVQDFIGNSFQFVNGSQRKK